MWRKARKNDITTMVEMFFKHLNTNKNYISHGELQMGIANDELVINEGAIDLWKKYIEDHIEDTDSEVMVNEEQLLSNSDSKKTTKIIGFYVLEINSDGAEPFGVICDMLVDEAYRGKGIGREIFEQALKWFELKNIKDIYLESGKNNHSAHEFFEKLGFKMVSHIFKLG